MYRLYHYPICPFSRKIRVLLTEKKLSFFPVVENFWERREKYVKLNPMANVPMLLAKPDLVISDSQAIAEFLEEQGFKVISPNSIIPSLLAPVGNLGTAQPDENDVIDISIGQTILGLLGHMDIGQAVIVENGYVLGIEAAEGTDSLISRSASLKREQVRKGVLVKMKKNNQDKRLDLPVIGLTTIENVYRANLRGIAISAQRSIIINFEEVIRLVNKYNIFIIGID